MTATVVAQAQVWRTWDVADGLADSYAESVQQDADSSIWVSHGRGLPLSVLDGHSVRLVSLPERADEVFAVGFGELWTVSPRGIHHLVDGEWSLHEIPEIVRLQADERMQVHLAALAPGQVAAVLLDRVLGIDTAVPSVETLVRAEDTPLNTFMSVARGVNRTLWIGCRDGILEVPLGSSREGARGYSQVIRLAPHQGTNVANLSIGPRGEIVAIAQSAARDQLVGLRWNGDEWLLRRESASSNLRLWYGPDGLLYAADGPQILRFRTGGDEVVPGAENVGQAREVVHDDDGSLWLATPQGLKLYAPSVWTAPPVRSLPGNPVHAAVEDDRGGLWFAARHKLLHLEGDAWSSIDLPAGKATYSLHVNAIAQLADGRLVLKTQDPRELLLFDVESLQFQSIFHPAGRRFRMIAPRDDGRIWVNTSAPNDRFDQDLAVYDGTEFTPMLDRGRDWGLGRMRTIFVDSDETVWIGGTEGIARWLGDDYEVWGEEGDLVTEGAYAILRTRDGRLLAGGRSMVRELRGDTWKAVARLGKTRDLAEDSADRLWVVGEKGVHTLHNGVWISHDARDGLPATASYLGFIDSHGRFWAGTEHGLVLHSPHHDPDPPQVRITGAPASAIFESSAAVSLRFLGIDKWKRTSQDRLLYQHSLDGGDWSPLSEESSFEHRGASAGEHELLVRVVDRNGNQTETDESFSFVVQAPWFLRTPFLLVATAGLLTIGVLLGVAGYSYRGKTHLVSELQTATKAAEAARAATEDVVDAQTENLRITNAELIVSREKAEEASRLKSEFVANISHEIRSPLTVIMGMTELVQQNDQLDAADRENLEMVLRSTEDLKRILDDVLDFSRIESQHLSLEQTVFDVILLAHDVESRLRPAAREKGIELDVDASQGTQRLVVGDATRVRQILTNLLGNAIKFTSQGSVRLTIDSQEAPEDKVELRFRVEDTGIGIPEEHQERMFEPFAQLDASTTRRFGGSGLGLAICSRLARLMSGDIVLESSPGEGSVFTFRACFPLPTESFAKAPSSGELTAAKKPLKGTRALIVDDISSVRELLRQVLTRWGCETLEAAGGYEAIAVCREKRPELVLMDIQMPGMSGLEAARAIREADVGRGRRTRILAVTARAAAGDRERYLEDGMDGYVSKPIDRDRLLKAILKALRQQPETAVNSPRKA